MNQVVPEELARLYSAAMFDASDLPMAKSVILTAHRHLTVDERWATETPYLLELISRRVLLTPRSRVVDFGCGVGRMAKALIEAYGCRVLGVDVSGSMRDLAMDYVRSPRFTVCSPRAFELMVDRGLRADLALAVWVFQHCLYLERDVQTVRDGLRRIGRLFVVGSKRRFIPVDSPLAKWADDGLDVRAGLGTPLDGGELDPSVVTREMSEQAFWGVWEKARS